MAKAKTWGQIGREVAQELEGMTDETAIAQLGRDSIEKIRSREVGDERKKAHALVSREIRKRFPNQTDSQPLYWYDPRGKGNLYQLKIKN